MKHHLQYVLYACSVLSVTFLVTTTVFARVPSPSVPSSNYLVGAFYFPNWRFSLKDHGWLALENFPDRTPLLGYYDEGNPEVADWEIKWATEHGVNFFIFEWIRCSELTGSHPCSNVLDKPIVTSTLPWHSALHDGFLQAEHRDKMKFAIMLTSGNPYGKDFSSIDDLRNNLMPYLINTYFKRSNYLTVDNKPVLYIFSPSDLETNLGSVEKVKEALLVMRQTVKNSGFADLIIMGHSWQFVNRSLYDIQRLKEYGYDYQFSYVTPVTQHNATEQQAIENQKQSLQYQLANAPIPFIVTASPFWDQLPYSNDPTLSHWYVSPQGYKTVISNAKNIMNQQADGLAKKMILLDAWNEWGEGHYIAPDITNRFGYLNAARDTLTNKNNTPDERLPSESGNGPYDSLYQQYKQAHEREYSQVTKQTYTFTSSGEFIDVRNVGFAVENSDTLTFGGWVKTTLTNTNYVPFGADWRARAIIGKDGGGHCVIATKNNVWYSSGTAIVWPAGKITANTWHHILCTYDGSRVTAYIDGAKIGTSSPAISGTIDKRPARLFLGYSPDSWNPSSVANFIFQKTVLSETEIQTVFQTSRPTAVRGDLNADNEVDIFDYNLLVGNFGKRGSNIIGDIDKNNIVDIFDYNELVANF